jgi:hypothetical protein
MLFCSLWQRKFAESMNFSREERSCIRKGSSESSNIHVTLWLGVGTFFGGDRSPVTSSHLPDNLRCSALLIQVQMSDPWILTRTLEKCDTGTTMHVQTLESIIEKLNIEDWHSATARFIGSVARDLTFAGRGPQDILQHIASVCIAIVRKVWEEHKMNAL